VGLPTLINVPWMDPEILRLLLGATNPTTHGTTSILIPLVRLASSSTHFTVAVLCNAV
jgi:hypothetical protein